MNRLLLAFVFGCGASAPPADAPASEPIEARVEASAVTPLPAGFYFRERTGESTCFDCATPTVAVVMDFDGELPSIPLALGYPRADRNVVILGLFETEADARRWLRDQGDTRMRVEVVPRMELIPDTQREHEPNPHLWMQSDPTSPVHAYSEQDVQRWLENGVPSDRSEPSDTPLCTLAPNTVWQVSADALGHAEMNFLSVPFTCPDGRAAFVRKQDTLHDATVRRTENGFEKLQRLYAECGDIGYLSVRYDLEGRELGREEFSMGPGCVEGNAVAERARRSCPGGTVAECVSAGRAHLDSDPRRGLQLLERACDFGHHEGCRAVATFVAELGGRDAMRQALYRVHDHCDTGDTESCNLVNEVLQEAAERADREALTEACELKEHDDRMEEVSSTACALLAAL